MADEQQKPPAELQDDMSDLETLESETPVVEGESASSEISPKQSVFQPTVVEPQSIPADTAKKFKRLFGLINIYTILFGLVLIIAIGVIAFAYFQSRKSGSTSGIKTQELNQSTLQKLAASDVRVGNSQQVLKVEANAIFGGNVLLKQNLDIAGSLHLGEGALTLANLTASGTSQLGQTQVSKDLSVAGNTALQGTVAIAKSLQVSGGGTFGGPVSAPQISTSSLQLTGDLTLTRHILLGGGTPGRSNGAALGSGGTASIGGSDSGGTVSINTGSGPGAGCFITVNFTQKYNSTPRVLVTPVGSSAGSIDYYVNRTTSSWSLCTSTTPPAGASFAFDYFVFS